MEVLFGVKSITELKPVDIALAKCENSISSARGESLCNFSTATNRFG